MVKFRVAEVDRARVFPIAPEPAVDVDASRTRAEALWAARFGLLASDAAHGLNAWLADLWRHYREGQRKRAAIVQLSALDDWALRDIGLDRGDIVAAVNGIDTLKGRASSSSVIIGKTSAAGNTGRSKTSIV